MKKTGLLLIAVALFVSYTASSVIEEKYSWALPCGIPVVMALSVERSIIAVVSQEDVHTIDFFDVKTKKHINRLHIDGSVTNLAFSPNNYGVVLLAVTTTDGNIIIYDIDNFSNPLHYPFYFTANNTIALSPYTEKYGLLLAVGGKYGKFVLFSLKTQKIEFIHLSVHVSKLAFSWDKNGKILLAAIFKETPSNINIFSLSSCEVELEKVLNVKENIVDLGFYPKCDFNDDFILAVVTSKQVLPEMSSSHDCVPAYSYGSKQYLTIKFWNVETKQWLHHHEENINFPTENLIFAPTVPSENGLYFAANTDNIVRVCMIRMVMGERGEYGCLQTFGFGCPPIQDFGLQGCGLVQNFAYHACAPVYEYGHQACPPVQDFGGYGCL